MSRAWTGTQSREARKRWAPIIAAGGVMCPRCGREIRPDDQWDTGHVVDLIAGGTPGPENQHPEHARCNRRAGQRTMQERRRRRQQIARRMPPLLIAIAFLSACGGDKDTRTLDEYASSVCIEGTIGPLYLDGADEPMTNQIECQLKSGVISGQESQRITVLRIDKDDPDFDDFDAVVEQNKDQVLSTNDPFIVMSF